MSVTFALTILAGVLTALSGILGNIAASSFPLFVVPYLRYAWPAVGVVAFLGIGVSIWQVSRDALHSSPSSSIPQKIASPSPTSQSAQQQNVPSCYHTCALSYATEDQASGQSHLNGR